ncbi:hypothetical protein [Hydrogenophaga sp.]|uniref:hypothetical protein n=1 Tax=Hydrogenophaga sp. TaxID=1904254 RepID=UPI003F6BFFF4
MFKPLTLLTLTAAICLGAAAASRDEAASDTGNSADGFWVATAPSGVNVKWGVLDNGDTWGIYDQEGTTLGAFHGSTRSSQSVLHGTGQTFEIPSRTVGAASFSGTYVPRQAISTTNSYGVGFSGRYVPGYDQPARLSELAGGRVRYGGAVFRTRLHRQRHRHTAPRWQERVQHCHAICRQRLRPEPRHHSLGHCPLQHGQWRTVRAGDERGAHGWVAVSGDSGEGVKGLEGMRL